MQKCWNLGQTKVSCLERCPQFSSVLIERFHCICTCMYVYITAVDCGNLMSLENGNVLVGMTTPGAVAVYTCDTSYELVGNPFRQCHENGTWSGEAPTCEGNY